MAQIEQVAVLGAGGTMGFPIAGNLARAGFAVRAWNRSVEKAQPLTEDGATVAQSPSEAVNGAQAIVTMLADADAVLEAVSGDDRALARAAEGALWIQMSTIGIEGTERCAGLAQETGVRFVDAPVLGTKKPAEDGELVVLGSGPEDAREPLAPVFDAIGKKTMWLGEAGAGTRLKLVTNAWILTVVEGSAETIALAEGIGVDPADFLEAIAGGPLDLPYLQMKGKAMIERDFEPSFRLALAAKDARLVRQAAERHELELPLLETIEERLEQGAAEHGDEDMAATYLTSAADGRG